MSLASCGYRNFKQAINNENGVPRELIAAPLVPSSLIAIDLRSEGGGHEGLVKKVFRADTKPCVHIAVINLPRRRCIEDFSSVLKPILVANSKDFADCSQGGACIDNRALQTRPKQPNRSDPA